MQFKLSLLSFFTFVSLFSQTIEKKIYVSLIESKVTIDGNLDEDAWNKAKPSSDFFEYFPSDSIPAQQQSEIKMLFDSKYLYVGIKVNALDNDFIIPSLRRDFSAGGNDSMTLIFDTFNDGTNAFIFGSNPAGVQREMLLSNGGSNPRDFNMAWDTKWLCESQIGPNYYTTEWAIPLSAFKFKEGETQWRFNAYHFDTQFNEINTWVDIPQNQFIFNMAYMGDMIFERPLGKVKTPISLIPYVNAFQGKDYTDNTEVNDFKFGGDAKFTIANSLNVDLTVNPDFSQVEVDQQITNLSRFEISLPERRQFFIDNGDLFDNLGNRRDANPFFSRRIGIASDKDGNTIENRINAGVKLSGKINKDLRIGFLNMQTDEDVSNEIAASNNTVLTLQQKLFKRSNLNIMFINKQATADYDFLEQTNRYNRVIGLDYNLASEDNTWIGNYYLHKSFSPDKNEHSLSAGASTTFSDRNWNIRLSGVYIGENFRSDLGFIRRTDIIKMNPGFEYTFRPNNKIIQRHGLEFIPIILWRPSLNMQRSDYLLISRYNINFQNNSQFSTELKNEYTYLFDTFDPTDSENGKPLPSDTGYHYNTLELQYESDRRKTISYELTPSYGGFYNGTKFSFEGQVSVRLQPYFRASMQLNYDQIDLAPTYPDAKILLLGPRFDITLNKKLFWSTFIQYSNQRENLSINSRLQWRFAPLSDLFLVYNDNYNTTNPFIPKVRSFNLKLTYWLNI